MAQKTFFLAPNFTLHPGGALALGSVIADPSRPTKILSALPNPPETDTHVEFDRSLSRQDGTTFHGKTFASFLTSASANLGGEVSKSALSKYDMDSMATVYFKRDVTDDEVTELVLKDSKVRAAINSGLFGKQPVYVVTGLKVAKGFRLTTEVGGSKGATIGASVPIVEGVGIGAEIGGNRSRSLTETLSTQQDIIFAYQLHKVVQKGWRRDSKRIEVDVFMHKAAALGERKEDPNQPFELLAADAADLEELVRDSNISDFDTEMVGDDAIVTFKI